MIKKVLSMMLLSSGIIVGSQLADVPKVSAEREVYHYFDLGLKKDMEYVFETTKPSAGDIYAYTYKIGDIFLNKTYIRAVEPNIDGKYTTMFEAKLGLTKDEVAGALVVLTKSVYLIDGIGYKKGEVSKNSDLHYVFFKHNGVVYYFQLPCPYGYYASIEKNEEAKAIYQAIPKYLELERSKS